jgi:hypothetical protein
VRIEIKSVDPAAICYSTCGDWRWLPDGGLQVSVPEYGMRDDDAFLVALHEMVEAWSCKKSGVNEEKVTAWDIAHPDAEEPGELPDSPYLPDHQLAMEVERKVCAEIGIDWDEHEKWVVNAANEVDRSHEFVVPQITLAGPRYWAELHLFALRHKPNREDYLWFDEWVQSLPFNDCPCKSHLDLFVKENPPDWKDFFAWTIELHNSVNDRIGKKQISVENARILWSTRSF